jgi:ribonuclease HII
MNAREEKLRVRYERMLLHERQAWMAGYVCLAGLDEAGRGPLAGPVAQRPASSIPIARFTA